MDDQESPDDQRRPPHRARARADLHRPEKTSRSSALEFSFADKFAPRIGGAYDLKGDGRTKLFGIWGVFYDIFKLELPRGSFGGDKWLDYNYTLDTFNWPTLVDGASCPPACPGTLISGPIDFRHPSFGSDAIDPDLKPMRQQEATAGIEHQLNDEMAISARYVHKQVDRAIEDTGSLDAAGNEIYVIANPGEGLTALASTHPITAPAQGDARLRLGRVRVRKAVLRATGTSAPAISGAVSTATTRVFPSRTRTAAPARTSAGSFDYPLMKFDRTAAIAAYGPLATDRPHQFKTNFIYQFNFGTTVGATEYIASGLPVSRELGIYPTSNLPLQYLGRGSDGRTPIFSQMDFLVQHEIRLGDRRLQLSLNVINLFNQDTAVSKYSTYQAVNGVVPDEFLFYTGAQTLESLITSQNVRRDPRFLMDNGFQAPIKARVRGQVRLLDPQLKRCNLGPAGFARGAFFCRGTSSESRRA